MMDMISIAAIVVIVACVGYLLCQSCRCSLKLPSLKPGDIEVVELDLPEDVAALMLSKDEAEELLRKMEE